METQQYTGYTAIPDRCGESKLTINGSKRAVCDNEYFALEYPPPFNTPVYKVEFNARTRIGTIGFPIGDLEPNRWFVIVDTE